jgi:hypothetical protein
VSPIDSGRRPALPATAAVIDADLESDSPPFDELADADAALQVGPTEERAEPVCCRKPLGPES